MTQSFSVYVYVEFQIRGNIAKLYVFKGLQNMYEKITMSMLRLNHFRYMFMSSCMIRGNIAQAQILLNAFPDIMFFPDPTK